MKIEKYCHRQAQDLVDLLFDKEFISKDCDLKSIRVLKSYIAFLFQSQVKSEIRAHDLLKTIKK